MGKDSYWFRHDSNARNDPKMCQLLMLGGQSAKGSFWDIVEILRESDGYKIPLDKLPAISFACRFPDDAIDQMVECGLIERDEKFIWSKSLNRRMKHLDVIKKKRAVAGSKGGKAKAIAKQVPSNSQAKGKQNSSIAKRSDLNRSDKNRVDKKVRKGPLPKDWKPNDKHTEIANTSNADLNLELDKFRDYAKSNNWKKVDWNATFNNWLRNSNGKSPQSNLTGFQGEKLTATEQAQRRNQAAIDAFRRGE